MAKAKAEAAMAPPKADKAKKMTLELKVGCTTGAGNLVENGLKANVMQNVYNKTNGAITSGGNCSAHWDKGLTSSDLTIKFPIMVDCNRLIQDSAGGKMGNLATNLMDVTGMKGSVIASQIQGQVQSAVSAEVNGLAAELLHCKVY